jgi:hypothetical protein
LSAVTKPYVIPPWEEVQKLAIVRQKEKPAPVFIELSTESQEKVKEKASDVKKVEEPKMVEKKKKGKINIYIYIMFYV